MQAEANGNWYAIQTRTGTEACAVQTLDTLGLETFLPRTRSLVPRRHGPAWLVRPLFPGYCFARFRPERHFHAVKYSRGVVRVVGSEATPWLVEDSIIEEIRSRLDDDGVLELQPQSLQRGDPVRIHTGPLEGWTGIFDSELDDSIRVVVLLHAIRQARVVTRRDWLEPAEAV